MSSRAERIERALMDAIAALKNIPEMVAKVVEEGDAALAAPSDPTKLDVPGGLASLNELTNEVVALRARAERAEAEAVELRHALATASAPIHPTKGDRLAEADAAVRAAGIPTWRTLDDSPINNPCDCDFCRYIRKYPAPDLDPEPRPTSHHRVREEGPNQRRR